MTGVADGVAVDRVTAWLLERVPDLRLPLRIDLISGGHSNLTYGVRDAAGGRWVLRRPPLGHVLPTAHDMAREYRVLAALRDSPVPVPRVLGLCEDPAVNGAPFYVMALVEGEVLRTREVAATALSPAARRSIGLQLAETLAAIHQVVPADVGLADLGRPDGYVPRQLRRWRTQLATSRTRPLTELDDIHRQLTERLPEQQMRGIVHGDFRLDNCIVGAEGQLRAVLDWELCTLGDPMADVGMLMVYWAAPDDPVIPLSDPPTLAPGFPSRDEMLDRYAAARGVELPDVGFYVAFGYWRLACITEGVYARYLRGDMGDRQGEAAQFERRVVELGAAAQRTLDAR